MCACMCMCTYMYTHMHMDMYRVWQKEVYSYEYASLFLYYYLLIIVLFSILTTVSLLSPHPDCVYVGMYVCIRRARETFYFCEHWHIYSIQIQWNLGFRTSFILDTV